MATEITSALSFAKANIINSVLENDFEPAVRTKLIDIIATSPIRPDIIGPRLPRPVASRLRDMLDAIPEAHEGQVIASAHHNTMRSLLAAVVDIVEEFETKTQKLEVDTIKHLDLIRTLDLKADIAAFAAVPQATTPLIADDGSLREDAFNAIVTERGEGFASVLLNAEMKKATAEGRPVLETEIKAKPNVRADLLTLGSFRIR